MAPRRSVLTVLSWLWVPPWLAVGCGTPPLPPGFTTDEAAAFQREHEAVIGGELGPLAAVASHYVHPGHTLVLRVADGQVVEGEGPGPRVRLEPLDHGDGGARCLEGCDDAPRAIEEQEVVSLDRFSLLVSPQSGSTRVLVHDPEAPARKAFEGLPWFPVDDRAIVPARFQPDPARPTVELATSRGLVKELVRAGVLEAELMGRPVTLVAYQPSGAPADAPLLVPFTDATTGIDTYPIGRYLEVELPESGPAAVDFNRATNPWCAYSEHFNCPVPPTENSLPVPVLAGEQTFGAH